MDNSKLKTQNSKLILLLLVLLSNTVYGNTANINNIRIWQSPENTMLIFDTSHQTQYTIAELDNPKRILVTIKANKMLKPLHSSSYKNTNIIKIKRYKNKGNIIFELTMRKQIKFKYYELEPFSNYGYRIVLDIDDTVHNVKKLNTEINYDNITNNKRNIKIVIDPGHGGEDPGATAINNKLYEKHLVLKVAKKMQTYFDNMPGFEAHLTRKSDYYIKLGRRTDIAHKYKADAFISVHADSFTTGGASGASIYTLSTKGATSESARKLAERENLSDLVGGIEVTTLNRRSRYLQDTLFDLRLNETLESSIVLGNNILPELNKITKLHKKQVEQAEFVVLQSPSIPSILIECGFLSNSVESNKLNSTLFQAKLAEAVTRGVKKYFYDNAFPGTYIYHKNHRDKVKVKVKKNDSLSTLSKKYNVSINAIKKENKLKSNIIKIGQELLIPNE